MTFLIIRLSSMGDVVLVTPVIDYLRVRYPGCAIDLVTGSAYAPLFEGDPRVRQVVAYDKHAPHRAISQLNNKNIVYDRVIDLQNNRRSRELCAVYRTANVGRFSKLWVPRAILLWLRINIYPKQSSVVERYLHAAGATQNSWNTPPLALHTGLYIREPLDSPSGFFDKPVLALAPFAAWKNKAWPLARFAEVAQIYCTRGYNVVIIGGEQDGDAGAALQRTISAATGDAARCVSVAGRTTLRQSAGWLCRCTLLVCGDTGAGHLARACGIPTVHIYGSTTRHFGFFPYGTVAYRTVQAPCFCRPCHPHGGNFCWRFSRPCLKKIQAARVVETIDEILGSLTSVSNI